MVRFAARQFRTQAVVAAVGLAAVGLAVLLTGPHLAALYHTSVAGCAGQGCDVAQSVLVRSDRLLQVALTGLVLAIPGIIGIFWGAPLVARELETGTFRLAWTQTVTRTRWLVVKLVLVALAALAVTALLSVMATWWFSPIDRITANRFDPTHFGERGIVPVGYAAFAVALGTAAGLVVRRTVAAMALTLAFFVGVLLVVSVWVRPHLIPPVTAAKSVASAGGFGFAPNASGTALTFIVEPSPIPNAWILSSHVVDDHGKQITAQFVKTACPRLPPPSTGPGLHRAPADKGIFLGCIHTIATVYHVAVTYQPAGRYWIFQSIETGIFVLLALVLGVGSVWWVRRRIV